MEIVILLIAAGCPVLGLALVIIYFSNTKKDVFCALIAGLVFSAGLYGYIADAGSDIYRHISNLQFYKGISFTSCFDRGRLTTVYTWDIWSWIIARIGNEYLLQASGAFLGYSLISYIVMNYAKINNLKLKDWTLVYLVALLMVSPLNIAIGIRNADAFLICCVALYKFYVHKKNYAVTTILLFVAIFLHHSAVLVLAGWVIMPIFKEKPFRVGGVIIIALFTFNNYGDYLSVLSKIDFTLSNIATDTLHSALSYQNLVVNSFHSIFTRYWQLFYALLIIIRGCSLKKAGKSCNKGEYGINLWYFSTLMFIIGCCLTVLLGSNGNRFFIISTLLGLIPFMKSCLKIPFLTKKKWVLSDGLILCGTVGNALLYLNDMAWGTASIGSLGWSILVGFFSRFVFI